MIPLVLSAAAFGAASLRWNWWRKKITGLPVLAYHKIGRPPENSKLKELWVSPKQFASQVDYLLKRGYTTLLFSELAAVVRGQVELPKKPVLITFDDGYRNNYEIAYPILREKNAKGNIFLVANALERENFWHNPETEPRIQMISWPQANEMLSSGVMDMGSHTMNHPRLTSVSLEIAEQELRESKDELEQKLGRQITAFAYPYGAGAFSPQLRGLIRKTGYLFDFAFTHGVSAWPWNAEAGPLLRLFVRGDDSLVDFHLNMTRGKAALWRYD